jgi:hypothetical protein
VFARELERVSFSSELALFNARILDMLSLPASENVFSVRNSAGKILK